jgi:predicted deacetylase
LGEELKKATALTLIILVLVLIFWGATIFRELTITLHSARYGLDRIELNDSPPQLWVEVHDVSPGYGEEKLTEITDILDRHDAATDRVVLFVIPNHGSNSRISSYPQFTEVLRELSKKGFIIGLHGYTHTGGIKKPEFKTNLSTGIRMIEDSRAEFQASGLKEPRYFAPPGWQASPEVSEYLRNEFNYTYYAFFIDTPTGSLPYHTREYTWYEHNLGGLEEAKKDYTEAEGIFRLTLHLNAANTRKNLEFLDLFLGWVEGKR